MSTESKPRVAVIGTGGTISSVGRHSLDLVAYVENKTMYEVDELLDAFPETWEQADVEAVRFRTLPSTAVGPAEWLELNEKIHELAAEDPDLAGVVVTHGTATLEETAYFLNLSIRADLTVVLVGAQRPASGLGTDAGNNLVNAIRVAGDPNSRGRGVLGLLNDEIHSARDITKTSTLRLQTFKSRDFGLLGHADVDRISYYRRPERRHAPDIEFDMRGRSDLPRVDIVPSYAGSDGASIAGYLAADAKGLVSAGFAPGYTTPAEAIALAEASEKGIIIVHSTRAGSGRTADVKSRHAPNSVNADNLTPQKARVLLMMALTETSDPAEIQRMFDTY
jgi:L-asparaginase